MKAIVLYELWKRATPRADERRTRVYPPENSLRKGGGGDLRESEGRQGVWGRDALSGRSQRARARGT